MEEGGEGEAGGMSRFRSPLRGLSQSWDRFLTQPFRAGLTSVGPLDRKTGLKIRFILNQLNYYPLTPNPSPFLRRILAAEPLRIRGERGTKSLLLRANILFQPILHAAFEVAEFGGDVVDLFEFGLILGDAGVEGLHEAVQFGVGRVEGVHEFADAEAVALFHHDIGGIHEWRRRFHELLDRLHVRPFDEQDFAGGRCGSSVVAHSRWSFSFSMRNSSCFVSSISSS